MFASFPFQLPSLIPFIVIFLLIHRMKGVTSSWQTSQVCVIVFLSLCGQASLEGKSPHMWKTHLANSFLYTTGRLRIIIWEHIAIWIASIKTLHVIFSSVFSLPFCFVITVLNFIVAVVWALHNFQVVLCTDWLYYCHYGYSHLSPKMPINSLQQHGPCCLSASISRPWRNVCP